MKRCDCGTPIQKRSKQCRSCELKTRAGNKDAPASVPTVDSAVQIVSLREAVRRYKTAYEEAIARQTAEERIIRLFETSIAAFPAMPARTFRLPATRSPKIDGAEAPVLLLGDQHIGEMISSTETYGINTYDFVVYQQRLEFLENRVLDILLKHQRAAFDDLTVLSLGDNVSGLIHEELEKYSAQHIVDQVYLGALTTALFLYRLKHLGGFRRMRVLGVSGNHGRVRQEKESKQYYKNFDYLFHSIVSTALRGVSGIEVLVPRCLFAVIEVAGRRLLVSHGHELPPSSLGIPLYSINRASAAYQELLSIAAEERFDYWCMGHYHRPMELDNSIVNGTMAGLSEFGIGKFKPIRPMQRLIGFHERYGKAWEYPIWLDLAPKSTSVYTFSHDMPTTEAIDLFAERVEEATA